MSSPRTINQPGNGTDTQQFELAPGLLQYVQSVYVEVDNTAGAAARPTLTLSEQSGVVIAKKRQGEAIPAAGTGSATWALRLTDEGGGDGIKYDTLNSGDWLSVETTAAGAPFGAGVDFFVDAGDFNVIALAGQVYIDGSSMQLRSEDNDLIIDSEESLQITAAGSGANVWDIVGPLALECGDNFDIQLVAGKSVTVHDHLGNAIFKVNEDGSLQGKTGKTLTFNL